MFKHNQAVEQIDTSPKAGRAEVLSKGIAIGGVFAYARSLKV